MGKFNFYISKSAQVVYINNSNIHFDEHCHTDDFVFTFIIKGTAEIKQNKLIRSVSAGDVFYIVPYQAHSLVSDDCVDLLSICIKKSVVFSFSAEYFSDYLNDLLKFISEKIGINTKPFEHQINNTFEKYHSRNDVIDDIFKKSRENLIANPEIEKSIDEYAKGIYVSEYYYIRKIKEASGLTPHKLIIQSRIRKAQSLLYNGMDISQTALIMGFYDQSHFNKYFKKIVGITPVEYLKSLSNFLLD